MAVDEVRPGYKRTEVGIIPEDWEVRTIGDSQPFVTSGSRGWARYYSDHGAPMVRITNLKRGSIRLDTEQMRYVAIPACSAEGARTSLQDGDILVSITADIGIIGFVDSSLQKPAYINQHIALVRLSAPEIHPHFVSYFVASAPVQDLFRAITDAGAKAGINLPTLRSIPFALPPGLLEQQLISQALSDIQITCETFERLIAKKRELKQAAMQELLRPKAGWARSHLREVCRINPETLSSSTTSSEYVFEYLSLEDVERGVRTGSTWEVLHSAPSRARRIVRQGDVLFGTVRPNLLSHWLAGAPTRDLICSTGFAVLRTDRARLLPEFLYSSLFAPNIRMQVQNLIAGSNYPAVSSTEVSNLEVDYPASMTEQTFIASNLADMDAEIAALEARLDKYRDLKQGMMQKLLNGAIRIL